MEDKAEKIETCRYIYKRENDYITRVIKVTNPKIVNKEWVSCVDEDNHIIVVHRNFLFKTPEDVIKSISN